MVGHALACLAHSGFPPIWRDRRYFSVVENRRLRTGKMAQHRVLCLAGEYPAAIQGSSTVARCRGLVLPFIEFVGPIRKIGLHLYSKRI